LGRLELLNRFGDNIIVFDILRPEWIPPICDKFLHQLRTVAQEKLGITLEFAREPVVGMIRDLMLRGDNLLYGGRRVRTLIEATIERPLNLWIFRHGARSGDRLVLEPAPNGTEIQIRK
jgi:ATP-dependent Clp protease ATP-binding subunit ClpA